MRDLGFKRLTRENWLQPGPAASWGHVSADGQIRSMQGEDWIDLIVEPQLNESVPIEVQKLFEVARGSMAYGYFFYPLFTLASEQLYRVVDTAVTLKCQAIGAPKSENTFELRIDYLVEKKIIPKEDAIRWHATRKLRNIASHPESQSIILPLMAIDMLAVTTNQINLLFPNPMRRERDI